MNKINLFIVCGLLISFASTAREVKVKTGIEVLKIGRASCRERV